jgi:hypothetical protein
MFFLCGSMEYMFWSSCCTLKYGLAQLENAAASYTASSKHAHLFERVYGWCLGIGWLHEFDLEAGVLTCPDCMNLVPVLLTWHSTLYSRHTLHMVAKYKY